MAGVETVLRADRRFKLILMHIERSDVTNLELNSGPHFILAVGKFRKIKVHV
jgi:hypothetical protein